MQGNYSTAMAHFNEALALSRELADLSSLCPVYAKMGTLYLKQAQYPQALKSFFKVVALAEKAKNKMRLLYGINGISVVYSTMGFYDEAIPYYIKGLKLHQQLYGSPSETLLLSIGDSYYKKGDYKTAINYFEKAYQVIKTPLNQSICLSNMGLVYIKTKEYSKALTYLTQANAMADTLYDEVGRAINYTGLSRIFYQLKNYPEALSSATKAITIAQKAGLGKELEEAYKALSDVYAARGNYTQAYQYQSKHIALHDSIFSTENTQKIAFLQHTYELNKKQEQINLLTQTKQLQVAHIKNQNFIKYGLLAGLVVVLVFSGSLYAANQDKKRINCNLEERNKTISQISEQLKQTQQQLSSSLSLGSAGTWTINLNDHQTFTDENLADMMGLTYNPQGISLAVFLNCIHPEDRHLEEELRGQAIQQGKEYEAEYRIQHPEGKTIWLFARGRAAYNESGTAITFSGVSIDITDKKDADRHKNEFLSMANHELRTPVASTKGYLQLIERTLEKTHLSYPFALKATNQLNRLERLTADLMDVSKITAGELAYDYSEFNFAKVLNDLVESIQLTVSTHKLIVGNSVSINYYGDKYRIEQVLNNFICNAIKYSPDGEQVIIQSRCDDENIVVSVQDFGIGIPKEDIGKLNERFYRVRSSAKRYEGLGLGLYIASEILKQHSGSMWVESELGEGSMFYFSLPINKQNPSLSVE